MKKMEVTLGENSFHLNLVCNLHTRGLEVIKLECMLKLKIKGNDRLLTCLQAANICGLF